MTTDKSLAAQTDRSAQTMSWSRKVPVRYQADVAVIGGGIAGVSAACAAAKSGANVVLVERFAVTGGMMTTGGVANFEGQMYGQGEVFDRIIDDLKQWNALSSGGVMTDDQQTCFHYEILAIVLQEMLLRRKVKLLLHTRFVDVCVDDDGRISECIICGKSGPEALRIASLASSTSGLSLTSRAWMRRIASRPLTSGRSTVTVRSKRWSWR